MEIYWRSPRSMIASSKTTRSGAPMSDVSPAAILAEAKLRHCYADELCNCPEMHPDNLSIWCAHCLLASAARLLQQQQPLFWQHAISECNEAHATLDGVGAPKTRRVRKREGPGHQDITLGLAARIRSLRLEAPAPDDSTRKDG